MTPQTREWLKSQISSRRALLEKVVQDGILHGTQVAYRNGCRCDECRKGEADRRRRRRRNAGLIHNGQKTHCVRGHEFTSENTYLDKRQFRVCRACRRDRAKTQYHQGKGKE